MRSNFNKIILTAGIFVILVSAISLSLLCYAFDSTNRNKIKDKNIDETPEQVVEAMLDALKNSDWDKAVSYIDVKGILEEATLLMNNLSKQLTNAEKQKLEGELNGLTEEKVREAFINNMKEIFGNEFTYEIKGKTLRDDSNAVVFVEMSRNGKSKNDSIPLKKIDGKWLVSYRGLVKFTPPMGTK